MFCTHCGKNVSDEMIFCPYCGTTVFREMDDRNEPSAQEPAAAAAESVLTAPAVQETPAANNAPAATPAAPAAEASEAYADGGKRFRSGLATAIVFTVLSIFTWNPLAFVTGVLGIIFAGIASKRRNQGCMLSARSNAKAAKALNVTTIILTILWIALIVALTFSIVASIQNGILEGALEGVQEMTPQQLEESMEQFLQQFGYDVDIQMIENTVGNGASFQVRWNFG